MAVMRRMRGATLRLVRQRRLSITVGLVLAVPAGCVEVFIRNVPWWAEGAALVVGATGLALIWTGLTGPSPDWIE
jgi:membrane protein YdbS with pleckstrin-like domain